MEGTWKKILGESRWKRLMAFKIHPNVKYVKDFSCPVCVMKIQIMQLVGATQENMAL